MTKPHTTADELRTIKRLLLVAIVIVVGIGAIFWASNTAADHRRVHDQCVTGNVARQAIKDSLEDLYDKFIEASGHSQAALDFKADGMARLNKRLPQRQC